VLPGALSWTASAYAINISGQIVGAATPAVGYNQDAVLWQGAANTLTDLGTVDGIQYSTAHGINAAGQVVGTADPQCSPCVSAQAWIWQPGTAMTRLDSLIPTGSGWTLQQATGINDVGQIVGIGLHNGHQRGYLLTPAFHADINFQTAAGRVPTGYLADLGNVYGARSGGLSYGWNIDNTAWTRDRNDTLSADQRYETLIHLQKPGSATSWELAVPNGTYSVHLVAGDACCTDSVFRLNVEGTLALTGTPTATTHWFEKTVRVAVSDGRLTISNAAGSSNNKLNYVDITSG
jgi:probable HAF family extracellular repeat protein